MAPCAQRVLVAVSGGPDSVALLLWLAERREVAACHFDHAMRAESEEEARWVAALCSRLGVPLICGRRREPLPPGSRQAAARRLRYEFFERALAESGQDVLCLGHTADDLVEGAVLHLLRGSGLAGLRGMPAHRGPYVRPFLDVWRHQIEAYLGARGVVPLRDPSNRDRRFARVRVREELLPRLERDRPGLVRRLHRVARVAARFQAEVEAEAGRLIDDGGADRETLRQALPAVRMEVYRQLYGRLPGLTRKQLWEMDRLALWGRTGASIDLPGGLRLRVGRDRVSVDAGLPTMSWPEPSVRWCPGCQERWAVHLRPGPAPTIGHRRPGLRMRPLGAVGSRKLQDILTDAGYPRHLRDALPLVFAGGRLACVPGIAVDAELVSARDEAGWHLSWEGAGPGGGRAEGAMVPSSSANPRSRVT